MTLPSPTSHVAQLWSARIAEEADQNAARLANWHARHHRDPVSVPSEKAQIVWLASENVAPIKLRSV